MNGRGDTAVNSTHWRWLLLIIVVAAALRLLLLTEAPPGLTHDEADHGITAWAIVNGARGLYFTIGYGREPLYDYVTAAVMALIGPTALALRLTAAAFGTLTVAALYAWARRAFDRSTALLATAAFAVSFWSVMTARQSLRSTTLPLLFLLALLLFWHAIRRAIRRATTQSSTGKKHTAFSKISPAPLPPRSPARSLSRPLPLRPSASPLIAGLLLGLTLYTYIPARALWLLFPLLALYAVLQNHPNTQLPNYPTRHILVTTTLTLFTAALVAAPLFLHLRANPGLEVRIDELSTPLTALTEGDWRPLWQNTRTSLRLFTLSGDTTWRYNLPGRPFLSPLLGWLFYGGLLLAAWDAVRGLVRREQGLRARGLASFTVLAWLLLGMAPVFVTGPELAMTQAIGAQPVIYIFPALTLSRLGAWAAAKRPQATRWLWLLPALLFTAVAALTVRDYFGRWAKAPEVRVQYESTMVAAMDYLSRHDYGAAAVSTITPHPYHTPALAQLTLQKEPQPRWFNGNGSLLFPLHHDALLLFPGFAPLHPALQAYLPTTITAATLPLRETDLDRPLQIYRFNGPEAIVGARRLLVQQTAAGIDMPVTADAAARLLGYALLTPAVAPGQRVQVVTLWQAERPLPHEARIFVHMLSANGAPLAQQDRLDVPAQGWHAGDVFLQLHEFPVPAETTAGSYPLSVGIYTCLDTCENGRRLILTAPDQLVGDALILQMVEVSP